MAHIETRQQKRKDGSLGAKRYRVRYLTPAGDERSRTFTKWKDADSFAKTTEADKVRGTWLDPKDGKLTFREYSEQWREAQVHRDGTSDQVRNHLERHVYPILGDKPLALIRRSNVQACVKSASAVLAPATVHVVFAWIRSIFAAAVFDERIAKTPCIKISLPPKPDVEVVPPTTEEVEALIEGCPPRFRALVILTACSGMRQGEAFGLELSNVDFLRTRSLTVSQQLLRPNSGPLYIGPPKTPSSFRTIPLGNVALDALAQHLAEFPAVEQMVPRKLDDGRIENRPATLLFTGDKGQPIDRSRFGEQWHQSLDRARLAVAAERKQTRSKEPMPAFDFTFHGLRHYFASLLIRHGESVKTVQKRLGHKTPEETLRTYLHLWPDSDDRTRAAIDDALGSSTAFRSAAM